MAHDVFISYSSQDKAVADALCARLEGDKIRCWIAPRDVLAGIPYAEALTDALAASRLMVLVLSAKSNESRHVMREVESAVSRGTPIVPFRIEDVQPSKSLDYYLKSIHWLDALTPPDEWKAAPLDAFGVAHNRPPWASTIERLIASPIPMPSCLVV